MAHCPDQEVFAKALLELLKGIALSVEALASSTPGAA